MSVPQTPQQAEEILCRWAEEKYNLHNVVRVIFEPSAHGPYSEVTPDLDLHTIVNVYVKGKKRPHEFEVEDYYTTDLINEIIGFAKEST